MHHNQVVIYRQSIKRNGKNCVDFRLTTYMLSKMNKSIYEKDDFVLGESDSENINAEFSICETCKIQH